MVAENVRHLSDAEAFDLAAGTLDRRAAALAETHVATCARCGQLVARATDDHARLRAAIGAHVATVRPSPRSDWAQISAKIIPAPSGARWGRLAFGTLGGATVALILAVGAVGAAGAAIPPVREAVRSAVREARHRLPSFAAPTGPTATPEAPAGSPVATPVSTGAPIAAPQGSPGQGVSDERREGGDDDADGRSSPTYDFGIDGDSPAGAHGTGTPAATEQVSPVEGTRVAPLPTRRRPVDPPGDGRPPRRPHDPDPRPTAGHVRPLPTRQDGAPRRPTREATPDRPGPGRPGDPGRPGRPPTRTPMPPPTDTPEPPPTATEVPPPTATDVPPPLDRPTAAAPTHR